MATEITERTVTRDGHLREMRSEVVTPADMAAEVERLRVKHGQAVAELREKEREWDDKWFAKEQEGDRLKDRIAYLQSEPNFLVKMNERTLGENTALKAALTELVTLKALKDTNPTDYEARKPAAWAEARRVLGLAEVEGE